MTEMLMRQRTFSREDIRVSLEESPVILSGDVSNQRLCPTIQQRQDLERIDMSDTKTHYRKAFNSPYLSSADIVEPTILTVKMVKLENDKTKKTKDIFNTAYFVEKEIRQGEPLKPMILNATNSKTMKMLTGSPFIEDWVNVSVTIYVDHAVRFGKETMEGLRISQRAPEKKFLDPSMTKAWANAKAAYLRDGNLDSVLSRVGISEANQTLLMAEANTEHGATA